MTRHNYHLSIITKGQTTFLDVFSSRRKADKEIARMKHVMREKGLDYEIILRVEETYASHRKRNVYTGPTGPF